MGGLGSPTHFDSLLIGGGLFIDPPTRVSLLVSDQPQRVIYCSDLGHLTSTTEVIGTISGAPKFTKTTRGGEGKERRRNSGNLDSRGKEESNQIKRGECDGYQLLLVGGPPPFIRRTSSITFSLLPQVSQSIDPMIKIRPFTRSSKISISFPSSRKTTQPKD